MLAAIPTEVLRGIRLTLVVAAATGLIYPFAITGISQPFFNNQANGSLVTVNGQVAGSRLIGQEFTDTRYFWGRPSATVDASDPTKAVPYNAANSAGSNLAPSNSAFIDRVTADVERIRQLNYLPPDAPVPADLVTTDFSGFDPDISEASALLQVKRVAGVRGLDQAKVHDLVEKHLHGRVLGIFGEPHVNVLELNMALDAGEGR